MVRIKNILVESMLLFTLVAISFATTATASPIAPDFSLKSADNTIYTLNKSRGNVIYLDFWASWCGPCRKSFLWMNKMQSKYSEKGFEIIAINLDEKNEDATSFLKEVPAQFRVLFDPKGITPKLYDLKGMPSSFLVDRNGKILLEHKGFNDADALELEKRIQSALDGGK